MKKLLLVWLLLTQITAWGQELSADTTTRPSKAGRARQAWRNGRRYTVPFSGAVVAEPNLVDMQQRSYTPQDFGAKADSTTDDTQAFLKLLKSNRNVFIPTGVYRIAAGTLTIANVRRLSIVAADGAIILSSDKTQLNWLFQNCSDVSLSGGKWGFSQSITANGGNSQHIMQWDNCQRIKVSGAWFDNSPEMGIAFTNCLDVQFKENRVTRTFRDGSYFRYCARVKVLDNKYDNCKDDAISFHDKDNLMAYVPSDKAILNSYGYTQSTDAEIERNYITNCYQGIASVSGSGVKVRYNTVINTVNGGISFMNFRTDDPAATINGEIIGNTLTNTNSTVTINGTSYSNNGQATAGRGAIAILSLNGSSVISLSGVKRSTNVTVKDNTILGSGALGMVAYNIDGLTTGGNRFQDCTVTGNTLGGDVVEVWEVTRYNDVSDNSVIDTRSTMQHQKAYNFSGVSGAVGRWLWQNVPVNTAVTKVGNSPSLKYSDDEGLRVTALNLKVPMAQPNIATDGTTSFDSFTLAGTYQVSGGPWSLTINAPILAATAGNLEVFFSNDGITQRYTDYTPGGVKSAVWFRTKFGVTSAGNPWTAWQRMMTDGAIPTAIYSVSYNTASWTPGTYVDIIPENVMEFPYIYVIKVLYNQPGIETIVQSFVAPAVLTGSGSAARTTNLSANGDTYTGTAKGFLLRYGPGSNTAKIMASPSVTGLSGTITISFAKLF
ncbi:hypothetical protein FAES_3236 [Fibrella aestuarina BUZ 2]|uniref:Periplasmic copper-binding protein NosD beta helix domain-containing protein n=1 Tax=Fibrella aestuarina BUZ 2 TaxID=1166018 RepID=I0KAU2_9BACT|nr:NosD domain-containing protein [Fibrella aestuarina]CCH01245.1 hypothetical protein FAES_3236 [Fibrella aestuarina BUZ 2]